MKIIGKYLLVVSISMMTACTEYLNVVPDGVATIENAFTSRTTAEKFLFTCYSYMPRHGDYDANTYYAGDEYWAPFPQKSYVFFSDTFEELGRGNQSVTNPQMNYWDGLKDAIPMFRALRDCNIFLENIEGVPGMQEREKKKWVAEVKFLKAYYHFWLLRMYGPIPLVKENLPIASGVEDVQVKRDPVDAGFDYIVQLFDEAVPDLPLVVESENDESGRITKTIALAVKASVLTEAASPLFNGNTEFSQLANKDGEKLFNAVYDPEKWQKAAVACKEAIDACHSANMKLYYFNPMSLSVPISDTTSIQMSIRNSVADRWNSEVIWANTNSSSNTMQANAQARVDPEKVSNEGARSLLAPTLKVAEQFYTANGVPIDEDKTWNYANRYNVKTVGQEDKYNMLPGYQTAELHFKRENRFYASLGFDGGVWFGQGNYNDEAPWVVKGKARQFSGRIAISLYSVTGYWPKKLVHFQNVLQNGAGGSYSIVSYPWPVMRLADLYLLYAECLNESAGPSNDAYKYIDLVRKRAGLKTVEESWTNYSNNSTKHTTKEGLRSIIQQERLIELAFEGHRYWDIRRWQRAKEFFNQGIQGWDVDQEETALYYRVKTMFLQKFNTKDYFWPISEGSMLRNKNLVQNPGW